MSKPTKPAKKPTQRLDNLESDLQLGPVNTPKKEFYLAVLTMSWQLAIVVLVPLFIGNKLDTHFNTAPLWTLVGLVLALICVALIVWRQFKLFSPKIQNQNEHQTKEDHS